MYCWGDEDQQGYCTVATKVPKEDNHSHHPDDHAAIEHHDLEVALIKDDDRIPTK